MTRKINIRKARKESSSKGYLDFDSLEENINPKSKKDNKDEKCEHSEKDESRYFRESSDKDEDSDLNESRVSHEKEEYSLNRTNSENGDRGAEDLDERDGPIENTHGVIIKENQIKKTSKSKVKWSKPYKRIGFQVDIDQLDKLEEYKRKRRMAGETNYTYREALREAFELLFQHRPIDK